MARTRKLIKRKNFRYFKKQKTKRFKNKNFRSGGAPTRKKSIKDKPICSICQYPVTGRGYKWSGLCKKGHPFHKTCINEAKKYKPRCPVCRKATLKDLVKFTPESDDVDLGIDPEEFERLDREVEELRVQYEREAAERLEREAAERQRLREMSHLQGQQPFGFGNNPQQQQRPFGSPP
jgi:hypothetical protein